MNRFLKGLLLVLVLAYAVSPADLCPGPIDDLILFLMYIAGSKALPAGRYEE